MFLPVSLTLALHYCGQVLPVTESSFHNHCTYSALKVGDYSGCGRFSPWQYWELEPVPTTSPYITLPYDGNAFASVHQFLLLSLPSCPKTCWLEKGNLYVTPGSYASQRGVVNGYLCTCVVALDQSPLASKDAITSLSVKCLWSYVCQFWKAVMHSIFIRSLGWHCGQGL